MKKIAIILIIALAGIFITSCVFDYINYCPYCGATTISEIEDGVYKCDNAPCGKTFGAKEIDEKEIDEIE